MTATKGFVLPKYSTLLLDLYCKFSSGSKNKGDRTITRGQKRLSREIDREMAKKKACRGEEVYLRIDMKHCRKRKRYRLSRTRLRNSNNISAAESHRPRLTLDGGWRSEALCTNGRHQIFGKSNFIKRRHRPRDITTLNLCKVKMRVKTREKFCEP